MNTDRQQQPWWQSGVIYQIYPRSFQDSNGDGVGDLQGIIDRLDYLNDGGTDSLGVDILWISPFYPSPMADFGYDVSDYCNVDALFGDLEVFDRLVAETHRRGMRILIDFVPNHSSNQHPWFMKARSDRTNPRRNWYIWRDAGPEGGYPNNWGSIFGGPAWTWDEKTQQYYFHQFLPEQPDLNWRNPEVQQAMMDVLRFWLERGVDGFRLDVFGMIFKHPDMPDQPLQAGHAATDPDDPYLAQQHIYDQDQEETYLMAGHFRKLMEEYGDGCLLGEILWHSFSRWVRYYGENGDGLHLPMNFSLLDLNWNAKEFQDAIEGLEAGLPGFAWPNYVLGNHDRNRIATRFGELQSRAAAMLLLTLRGTPVLYYGDEIGLPNGDITRDMLVDPWGINLGIEKSRDFARTPMQWDGSPNAGFSRSRPWLPVTPDFERRNVFVQSQDRESHLALYRTLIHYRRNSPVLKQGDFRSLTAPSGGFVYERNLENQSVMIALNFTDREMPIHAPRPGSAAISSLGELQSEGSRTHFRLRPYEGLLIELSPTS